MYHRIGSAHAVIWQAGTGTGQVLFEFKFTAAQIALLILITLFFFYIQKLIFIYGQRRTLHLVFFIIKLFANIQMFAIAIQTASYS